MIVTIDRLTKGTCLLCRQQTDGVDAHFADGLKGFLCKKHFWSALVAREEESTPPASEVRKGTGNDK